MSNFISLDSIAFSCFPFVGQYKANSIFISLSNNEHSKFLELFKSNSVYKSNVQQSWTEQAQMLLMSSALT